MGDRYSAYGNQTVAWPRDSTIGLIGTNDTRATLYDIIIASESVPADVNLAHEAHRFSTSGAGTAFTPVSLDPGAPAAKLAIRTNHTTEPTYLALIMLDFQLSQRATLRWVAAPNHGLIVPALDNYGIGIRSWSLPAGSTPEVGCTIHWEE